MAARFSSRVDAIKPFLAMEVMERAFAMEREGARVIHLEVGEPDFPPPPAAVEACVRALQAGETRYTDSRGLAELREAGAEDHARRFGTRVGPGQVIVTSGTSAAMLLVFQLLVDPGDVVITSWPRALSVRQRMRSTGRSLGEAKAPCRWVAWGRICST